jgi:hypothetical protein
MDLGWCLGGHYYLLDQICAERRETHLVREREDERGVDRCLQDIFHTKYDEDCDLHISQRRGK